MKIGIIGAMEEEVSELKASLKDAKVTTIAVPDGTQGLTWRGRFTPTRTPI